MKAPQDTVILFGRSMRHIQRSPDTIITVAIVPIMLMLLFVYVFGGAIHAGTDDYVGWLTDAGLDVVRHEFVPEGDQGHSLVLARRPPAAAS